LLGVSNDHGKVTLRAPNKTALAAVLGGEDAARSGVLLGFLNVRNDAWNASLTSPTAGAAPFGIPYGYDVLREVLAFMFNLEISM
jgi:hypothetical protein